MYEQHIFGALEPVDVPVGVTEATVYVDRHQPAGWGVLLDSLLEVLPRLRVLSLEGILPDFNSDERYGHAMCEWLRDHQNTLRLPLTQTPPRFLDHLPPRAHIEFTGVASATGIYTYLLHGSENIHLRLPAIFDILTPEDARFYLAIPQLLLKKKFASLDLRAIPLSAPSAVISLVNNAKMPLSIQLGLYSAELMAALFSLSPSGPDTKVFLPVGFGNLGLLIQLEGHLNSIIAGSGNPLFLHHKGGHVFTNSIATKILKERERRRRVVAFVGGMDTLWGKGNHEEVKWMVTEFL